MPGEPVRPDPGCMTRPPSLYELDSAVALTEGELVATIEKQSRTEAISPARDAFAALPWKSSDERSRILNEIADAIDDRLELLALADCSQNRNSVHRKLAAHAHFLRCNAEVACAE
jgi:acyl-CoA reductase-like NAD-dependent aldehyde dehydrogenase